MNPKHLEGVTLLLKNVDTVLAFAAAMLILSRPYWCREANYWR